MANYKSVWEEYEKGISFNTSIELEDTVEVNENFFIGKQWEGVEANGLPTPVFNFLKRVTLFQVASVTSDNLKMQAAPLSSDAMAHAAEIVNREFEKLFEFNKIPLLLREKMRNAAVDGDGCLYTYWDSEVETGHPVKGAIVTEVVDNTRVFFGNPRDRRVQKQPWIIISSREMLSAVKKRAKKNGIAEWDEITSDSDERDTRHGTVQSDMVTTVLKFWKNDDGHVMAYECTQNCTIKDEWDTGLRLYPITWLNWDYVQDCYHGMALITGLVPNQIFINKLFAMSMISLMTTAYPKIVYDKTRVKKWDNRVGAAIPVPGGDLNNVAKIIDPAQISPQISQFIELAVNYTQTFLGATSAALGDTRPDNTSAIIALQRAASVPTEITKQNLYQSIEDLGRIYIDFMGAYYGTRVVGETTQTIDTPMGPMEMSVPEQFNFDELKNIPMQLKLDVGASAYWSEIASMQTLDNLLMQGKIDLVDYLERVPDGYVSKRQELIDKNKQERQQAMMMQGMPMGGGEPGAPTETVPGLSGIASGGSAATKMAIDEIPVSQGYGQLQRALNQTGVAQ